MGGKQETKMMTDDVGNAEGQLSIKKMEEEEGMAKVESLLRGRLHAEEAASKLAKLEAQQMEFKVGELETQLKSEIKSRKKADKKLKFLIKKLNSLHIPYDLEKSDVSSVSSSVSSALTQADENELRAPIKINENGETEGYEKKSMSQTGNKDFESPFSTSSKSQSCSNEKADDQSSSRDTLEENKDTNGKSNEAQDDYTDELQALALVDLPKEPPQVHIDPLILDANVKQVLNALSRAKQRLLLSMERRHVIRVGSK